MLSFSWVSELLLVLILLLLNPAHAADQKQKDNNEKYREKLMITPLDSGKVLFVFDFSSVGLLSPENLFPEEELPDDVHGKHYRLINRDIGNLFSFNPVTNKEQAELKAFSLSLTAGRFPSDEFVFQNGAYTDDLTSSGSEVQALFDANKNNTLLDASWSKLVHTLGGMFCSSLQFMLPTQQSQSGAISRRTVRPRMFPFKYNGPAIYPDVAGRDDFMYGTLPRESVCTENLTPWLKLLPCRAHSGLASLLNAYKLFDSFYSKIYIGGHIECMSKPCTTKAIHLRQKLTVVFRRPDNFNLSSLLGRDLKATCPYASAKQTQIFVETPINNDVVCSNPDIPASFDTHPSGQMKRYFYELSQDMLRKSSFDLNVTTAYDKKARLLSRKPPVIIKRYQTGYGDEQGSIKIEIINDSDQMGPDGAALDFEITYFDMFPWFMRIHFHRITMRRDGTLMDWSEAAVINRGIDRERPYTIEMRFKLRGNSKIVIEIPFEKTLLRYTEYPPDANKGIDIGGGAFAITVDHPQKEKRFSWNFYTPNLIVSLPTPDFSMPYNVITLSSTVIALFFGSYYNILTRKFHARTKDGKTLFQRLIGYLKLKRD